MKIVPEPETEKLDYPTAPSGVHTMRLAGFKEDVNGKPQDVCDFTDGKHGSSLWIRGPVPEEGRKGNLWLYRKLAEALGDDAKALYPQVDADGHSLFDPRDFIGRWCKVTVNEYGVNKVERADPAVVEALKTEASPTQAEKLKAQDDIPF